MELLPFLTSDKTQKVAGSNISIVQPIEHSLSVKSVPAKETNKTVFSTLQLLQYLYLAGLLITLLVLVHGLFSVLMLFRKAKSIKTEGYRLLVIEKEIAAFSFGRTVIISQKDYSEHRQPILTHEQAHIQLNHFFDLLLLEIVRIFHWFNPFVYWLIREMKEIHEFQADHFTLNKGIDATQYQLLIIKKGVGPQRFALANSFNYCQIKKRIVMMNMQKQNRVWSWKVVAFLPIVALLLMAFGRVVENVLPGRAGLFAIGSEASRDSIKQWSEADFISIEGLNLLTKMGKTPNWKDPIYGSYKIDGKWMTIKNPYIGNFNVCRIQIDSKSQLWMNSHTKPLNWIELRDSIRSYFDYEFANVQTKRFFHPCIVNGVVKMSPQCWFSILSDKDTPPGDYQKFLNNIGNTIYDIRGKYSDEVFKKSYSQLNVDQREQIDITIPLFALPIRRSPILKQEDNGDKVPIFVESEAEYKADGKASIDSSKLHITLFKNAQVNSYGIKLHADFIEIDKASKLIYATGNQDSTGLIVGKPVITVDKQVFLGDAILYNFNNKKGASYSNGKVINF